MAREVEVMATQENDSIMNDHDDLNARPDPYVELVWENGQVMMQGQPSDQPNNNNTITTNSVVSQDVTDTIESRTIRLTTMESVSGNFPLPVTSTDMGLYQDGEMARWFNYSIQEPTPDDCTTRSLHDLSGATFNDLLLENILPSRERSSFSGDGSRNTSSVDEAGNMRHGGVGSEILQYPKHFTGNAPTESVHVVAIDSVCKASSSICAFTSMRLQKLNSRPGTSSCVSNFRHIRSLGGGTSNDLTKLENDEQTNMIDCDNFVDSAIVGFSTSCSLKDEFPKNQTVRVTTNKISELVPAHPTRETISSNQDDTSPNKVHGVGIEVAEVGENNVERVVAVSSVCSGYSGERASTKAERDLKRKSPGNEDSDGRSEEHGSESSGARQASTVRKGAKRTRAAEVHNLSERRRRDRINEKMRALQELIPNCNKVDKASMLDEAIEYLKTLQNQVQMLLMGAGMYIPPVALPHGMQHLNGAFMSQSSHVGGGMNMGMNMNMGLGGIGYGMNMLNHLNTGMKLTAFQGQQQFQGPLQFHGGQQFLGQQNLILSESGYQGMPNSGLTIGHPCPSQGVPVPIQSAPGLPVSGALTLKIPIESNFLSLAAIATAGHSAPSSSQVTMPIPIVIDSVTQPSIQTSNESIVRAVPSRDQSQTL